MFTKILTYLSVQNAIIVGAVGTICEVIVIVYNMTRKLKAENREYNIRLSVHIDSPDRFERPPKPNKLKTFMWSLNPLNVFRKPGVFL